MTSDLWSKLLSMPLPVISNKICEQDILWSQPSETSHFGQYSEHLKSIVKTIIMFSKS